MKKSQFKSPLTIQQGGGKLQEFFNTDNLKGVWQNYILGNFHEQIRLLPDSLIIGSGLLALLTQSFSKAIFFFSLLELGLIQGGLQKLTSFVDPEHTRPEMESTSKKCLSGFDSPTLGTLSMLSTQSVAGAFPSSAMFFLAGAVSYVVGSLLNQREELEALGSEYSSRYYIAIFTSFFFLLFVASYRLYFQCDTVGILMISLLFGFLVGALVLAQNIFLFGRESTNLLGIPLLVEKTQLYVCNEKKE